MNSIDREQVVRALQRIPAADWDGFIRDEGDLERKLLAARELAPRPGGQAKPTEEIIDLLGAGLVRSAGIRELLLRSLPRTRWEHLADVFRQLPNRRLHGSASQHGLGSETMATYWRQGGVWARTFCEAHGLPGHLAERTNGALPDDELLETAVALPELHGFQRDVHRKLLRTMGSRRAATAVLSLPTGAGKTRVAVEAVLDHLCRPEAENDPRNLVVWIAQSEELLRQAWACFRQAWLSSGETRQHRGLLRLVRAWGGRGDEDVGNALEGRAVVFASVQQLASWEGIPWERRRTACVIVDEMHRSLAPQHRDVLIRLGIRQQRRWKVAQGAAPLIGLTATPWRSSDKEAKALREFFGGNLLTPPALRERPIHVLQKRRILARVDWERLQISGSPRMSAKQQAKYDQMGELPGDFLVQLGLDPGRNKTILNRLLKLPKKASCIVFACSVEHAEILALALRRRGRRAAPIHGETPRHERVRTIDAFRRHELQFLCNVSVLTTGFDAPRVDTICVARPTASSLLYEQMVGRGMRGPANGGKESCLVLDVQDAGMPSDLMSFERVRAQWESTKRRVARRK